LWEIAIVCPHSIAGSVAIWLIRMAQGGSPQGAVALRLIASVAVIFVIYSFAYFHGAGRIGKAQAPFLLLLGVSSQNPEHSL